MLKDLKKQDPDSQRLRKVINQVYNSSAESNSYYSGALSLICITNKFCILTSEFNFHIKSKKKKSLVRRTIS